MLWWWLGEAATRYKNNISENNEKAWYAMGMLTPFRMWTIMALLNFLSLVEPRNIFIITILSNSCSAIHLKQLIKTATCCCLLSSYLQYVLCVSHSSIPPPLRGKYYNNNNNNNFTLCLR